MLEITPSEEMQSNNDNENHRGDGKAAAELALDTALSLEQLGKHGRDFLRVTAEQLKELGVAIQTEIAHKSLEALDLMFIETSAADSSAIRVVLIGHRPPLLPAPRDWGKNTGGRQPIKNNMPFMLFDTDHIDNEVRLT